VKEEYRFLYLKQKCCTLKEPERVVMLMLDEIHVASQVSLKSGNIQGFASNCTLEEASTVQVFLISSLMSNNKHVAAMVPVK